jgi:hypothetical protein
VALLGDPLVAPPPTGPPHDPLGRVGGGPDEPGEQPADLRDGDRDVDGASRSPLFAAPTARAAKGQRLAPASVVYGRSMTALYIPRKQNATCAIVWCVRRNLPDRLHGPLGDPAPDSLKGGPCGRGRKGKGWQGVPDCA